MLARSWERSNFIIAPPTPLPALNPCNTSCNWRLACRQVSISTSNTFHRISSRPMSRVLVVPFVSITRTVHNKYRGIPPVWHMFCTIFTRHIQRSIHGGVFDCSPGYASLRQCFKCSAQRWVYPSALCGRRRRTPASTYAYAGISSFTLAGSTCVARGRPGVCGSSIW